MIGHGTLGQTLRTDFIGGFVLATCSACGQGALTPDEAEQQLDVACGVLERALSHSKSPLPEAIAVRLCSGKLTRRLIERALEGHDPLPIVEHFPSDAGQ